MRYTIGFDLGGTKIAAALVRQDGKIISFTKVPLDLNTCKSASAAQEKVLQFIQDLAVDFQRRYPAECSQTRLKGIGLASAGPLNVEQGVLINPANFKGWMTFPILHQVQARMNKIGFKSKVLFQNDAVAAAFAEGWLGSAKKMNSFAVITIGTGIGTGVILNGLPCQTKGAGSEFGHTLIDFSYLKEKPKSLGPFTVEGIASGTGLIQRARLLGFQGHSVEELILEKDLKYRNLFDDMAWALAVLAFNLSIGFNLDGIFFSGGLIKIQDRFLKKTQKYYKNLIRQFNPAFECSLSIAKTKNHAAVLGAAYLPILSRSKQ